MESNYRDRASIKRERERDPIYSLQTILPLPISMLNFFSYAAMLPNVYVFHTTKTDHAVGFFVLMLRNIIKTLWTKTVRVAGRDIPYTT